MRSDSTRTISVTSGKGGVGKTTLLSHLALALSREGNRVLILDGDLGMSNVDLFFGLRSSISIAHVLGGECMLEDAIVEVAPNIAIIPGGSGVYGLSQLDPLKKHLLLEQVGRLNRNYDFLLVDTAPGIEDHVLYLNSAAQEILVVVTPDPASLTDAYALIKVLNQRYRENRFSVIANMVRDENEARQVFTKLSDVAQRFLNVSLAYRGHVQNDLILKQYIRTGRSVVQMQNFGPSHSQIRTIAENIKNSNKFTELKGGLQFFWNQLSGVA
ncbi:MAG: MinD/ParA family protein [Bdellovibrionales bacterium]